MRMTENEKQRIVKSADFLYDKGYTSKIKDYAISFLGDGISFIVSYERYSDTSDVLIKFMKENEVYSVGWIACVRSGLNIQPHLRNCRKITLPFKALDTIVPGIACCAGFHVNPCEIFI